jgi:iron complex outermembrane receptor protein
VLKNGTVLNSNYTFVPAGYQGPATDAGQALVANAGRYNLDLPDSIGGRRSGLLAVPEQKSYGLSLRRRFGSWLEVLLDGNQFQNTGSRIVNLVGATTTLSATAPNNPFTTPVALAFPATNITAEAVTETTSSRFLAGLVVRLPARWSAGLDYVWARTRQRGRVPQVVVGDPDGTGPGLSYTAALAAGALNVMRDLNAYPLDYTAYLMPEPNLRSNAMFRTDEVTVRGSGPLRRLPAGEMTLSVSALYRYERTPGNVRSTPSSASPAIAYSYEPTVGLETRAYTAELNVPVFAADAASGWRRGLELQLAARRDEGMATVRGDSPSGISVAGPDGPFPGVSYVKPDFADTTGTAGFKYSPVKDLTFRGSWGTGFLMPTITQLTSSAPTFGSFTITDPWRNNVSTNTPFLNIGGGNPNLKPEKSESLSGGVILTPRFLPGFRFSVDYTHITKTDELGSLSNNLLFANEDLFPERIVRAPLTDADRALGYTRGAIQQIDLRTTNLSGKRLTAYDFQADYTWKTSSRGEFQFYALATYQPEFSTKTIEILPYVKTAGTLSILKWRGNGGVNWTKGRWTLGWNMQYYDSYQIYSPGLAAASIAAQVLNQGSSTIPSQVYHDVQARYEWGAQPAGWQRYLAHTQLSVGVQNILNTRPPALATTSTTGGSYSSLGDPRLARYGISLRKHF